MAFASFSESVVHDACRMVPTWPLKGVGGGAWSRTRPSSRAASAAAPSSASTRRGWRASAISARSPSTLPRTASRATRTSCAVGDGSGGGFALSGAGGGATGLGLGSNITSRSCTPLTPSIMQ